MEDFIFDLQRFATQKISENKTYKLDGVNYTAITDAVLNLDDNGKISGIASGKVQATVADLENSPIVTFDATNNAFNFTSTSDGKVISITPFPIEFISGEFTYNGGRIDITAGSDLAIVTKRGDFVLRNQNHFINDSAYIFSSTSLTSESQHVISDFSLTNGDDVRQLHLEQLGTVINNFDETGFTLVKGSSEVLNIGDYKITATAKDKDAGLNIDLGEEGLTFVPNTGDGTLTVALSRNGNEIISGELECTSGKITFGYDKSVKFDKGTSFNFTYNNYVSTITATDDATTDISLTNNGIKFTPGKNDGGLRLVLTKNGKTVFGGVLNITDGTITFNTDEKKFSFTKGTKISLGIGNDGSQEMDFEVVDKKASFKMEANADGSFTITPDENDGSINITLKKNGNVTFKNNLSIKGSLNINPETDLLTLTNGTIVNVTFDNYTITATADGDASSTISLTENGILITPQTNDKGKLDITLKGTSSGSLSAKIEVLSGGFLFGTDGALTVTKNTELQIDFGNNYIVNFKATAAAGGAISIGTDGITFAPNSDEKDGGLQLTVKRGDDTRSASLDVTGSVTYKLDGSISLTKGTVVKNVFDSGNILTITANTDASGSINFNPQTGLTIKPTTTDALTVSLTTSDIEVVNITSIDGSITYQNGIVTATDGTKARITYYFGWKSDLYTKGGTASVQFTDDRTIYTANAGATFTVNYLDGTTTEIQHGSYADVYGETIEDYVELVSEGTTLKNNDSEVVFTLEKAGDYNLNGIDVTTSEDNTKVLLSGDYDTVQFAADAGITVSATEDKGFRFGIGDDGTITITTTDSGDFGVSSGSITFGDGQATIAEGTTTSLTTDERVVTFTANKDISVSSKIEEDIYYLTLDEATADVTIAQDGQTVLAGEMVIDGVFSYRPKTGTFGLTGANSSHGDGNNTSFQFTTEGPTGTYTFKAETNDTTVVFIPNYSDGKFEMNFPNEAKNAMKFTVSKDGQTVFENNVAIDGTIGFDTANQELSLTKDTVLTLTQGENSIEITALGDAGGKLNIVDGGLRFAPNKGDGQLELNFVSSGRKANIDVTGAVIFGEGGKISLENGTEVTFTWDDGTVLKMTSEGSTGSIGIDEKGIKITSEDENLTIDLTTATGDQSHLSGIKGTIYYNAGRVSFDDNSTITATTTLGGEPILITLETIDGTGHLEFASNGIIYSADTGAMQITWKKDDVESTFTVNSGSVQIGHGLFQISEGTNLATDLKDFVPALYFTTSKAGTYTINGQTITTSAANISMTATDDYMTFKTSDDAITYDDMTFAGNGNVSLSTAGVVLGAGVVADGFGKDKMFILAEAGNVTADNRIFTMEESYLKKDGEKVLIPMNVSVEGVTDGFNFSRTLTEESEEAIGFVDSPDVGKVFKEKFIVHGDDSYQIVAGATGLQKVVGISKGSTVEGGAVLDGKEDYNWYVLKTDTNGDFTIGEKTYTIAEDSTVGTEIRAYFNDGLAYADKVNELNGTISGNFTAHEVSINGSASAVQPIDDTLISIAADDSGFKIFGLDEGASLKVSAKDNYIVNGTTINANAGDYIVGLDENSAFLMGMNNDTIITGTENDDYISNSGSNVTINALGGNDTIDNSGDNASIDAGAGSNQIKITGKNEVILLKGRTTVEGFNTGFGDGSDTIYIKPENDPAGVEFLEDGLTFGNETASLTLSDVNTTAKVNLFHENRDVLNKGVFIAAGDWYKVEESDLTVDAGEEVYFVGTAAKPSAGVDFSNITADLNITMDTEWEIPGNTMWVNGIYSLKGGAGNTTITGSAEDDTIISGSGSTTINAAGGDDLISLTGGAATINYKTGNGNDTIRGFNETSNLLISTSEYSTAESGNDLIVTVGESKITLIDAASLSSANIQTDPIVQLAETILKRTPLGYPAMAAAIFDPEGNYGDEPTNYVDKEDWTITSADDLKLHAVHYTPENSNDKWVVLIHGYGNKHTAMYTYAQNYLANGYNVLMIDQRTAGESEGTWLTMGAAEAADVALWTQEIASINSNAKITLHGVSMGAATAMLAAARSDTKNVTSIVEDCGYSDVRETFDTIIANTPAFAERGITPAVVPLLDSVAADLTGYYLHDAAPIDSIASVKMPSLFISGDADTVAPVNMLEELYDASGADVKEKFIVEGSKHALAVFDDSIGYNNAVFRFVAEADGEGWVTTNTTDGISLRGTKYDDTITNSGDNVTINASAGDDLISLSGSEALIHYAEGDGNDSIYGFDEDATLSIGDSTYSTQVSGNDLIITVGESKITLVDAANLTDPNIESTNEAANLLEILLKRTALGYPIASGVLLNPEELIGEEPTNYSAKEEWTITSADNLELYGVHYAPENSNDKWVVLVHGYGLNYESMYPFTAFYLENGYNVLMIDQRAAGNSEGTWLTMGAAESQDVALWTQEIARRNSNAKITLHGVSMGAATAMLAASREDAVNVTSLIEDCGYTDTIKLFYIINDVLKGMIKDVINDLPDGLLKDLLKDVPVGFPAEVVAALDSVGYGMMGYYLHDASPINSISSAKMPSLFIHGDDDGVVPVSMVSELYDASGAEVKEKFIVEGAGHAQSGLNDLVGYSNTVFRFIAEANGEGWVTTNTTDEISLRGTKYDDTITNSGDDVTINGGKGNDSLNSTGDYVQFDYTEGDGNDTIYGFNDTDRLSISGADYTPIKSGNDIIVTVDEGSITLVDAASLSTTLDVVDENGVIIFNSTNDKFVTGTDEADYIFNDATSVTITGLDGNDYIENSVDSSLTAASLGNYIDAGEGNDTIYNYRTYNPTLLGGEGNDSIVVTRGHLTYVDGGTGNDTIIGKKDRGGWDMGGYATVLGDEGNDYIDTGYTNSASIDGGAGNDTIYASGNRITINGGEGNNLIKVSPSTLDANNECAHIVLNGNTTVQGFKTGFGKGTDSVYITGESPAVDFKANGLTLYYDDDDTKSLTFTDIKKTTKLNLYYEASRKAVSEVFIADDEWYKVTEEDLSVMENSELLFVGATAKKNHGIDFSGIESDLNVSLLGHNYPEEVENLLINNIHSIKGGAGLTTITGSDTSDTIITGSGDTTINASGGDDYISLTGGEALINYKTGDGSDSIFGFSANATLSISGGKYSREINDDDVILTIGDDTVTLFGASDVDLNIIGNRDVPVEEVVQVVDANNVVSLSSGNQTLKFNDDGGNLAIVNGNGGDKTIELGNGGDAVAVYADEDSWVSVDVIGGTGNDSLIVFDNAPVTFDMSAGGADMILLAANQRVILEGYDASTGSAIATGEPRREAIVSSIIDNGDVTFGNGRLTINVSDETNSIFVLGDNTKPEGSSIVNFADIKNELQPVGFTHNGGGTLDVSGSSDDYLLVGNYFDDNKVGSTILGGDGDDTLLGGAGDLLNGGKGDNQILLTPKDSRQRKRGATIQLAEDSNNTIENFNAGFDSGSDVLLFASSNDTIYTTFDGTSLEVTSELGSNATVNNVANGSTFVNVLLGDEISVTKTTIIQEGEIAKVNDLSARAYFGNNSGVDFSGVKGNLSVSLSGVVDTNSDATFLFSGINYVEAGSGNATLIGSDDNDTLIAGTGNTSIRGGGGNDSLVGKGGAANKTGSTTFIFDNEGHDTISGFDFLTSTYSGTEDRIDVGNNIAKTAHLSGDDVVVEFEGGNYLTLADARGKDFRIGDLVAKVDSIVAYDGTANCYVASGGSTLTVDSTVGSAEIWLDNSHGDLFLGNIITLDASAVKGNTSLVGNDFNNTITAGQGDASLWGGNGGNDLLIGGGAHNTFFYFMGNGKDTIQGTNDGDEVILENVSLDQITSTTITANAVFVNFADGGSFRVNGQSDVTYQLADGTRYSANHAQGTWNSK